MNKKAKENQIIKLNKFVFCVLIGIVLTLFLKDFITPIIFNGRSFAGRSLFVKVTIYFIYTLIISALIMTINYLIDRYFYKFTNKHLGKFNKKLVAFLTLISENFRSWRNENPFLNLILKSHVSWIGFTFTSLVSILFYLTLEWIFIISKPSFMTILPISEKFTILSFAFSLLSILTLLGIILVFLLTRLFNKMKISAVILIIPSVIFTTAILLMLDNITYTIFGIGIISSNNFLRVLYLLIFLLLSLFLLRDLIKINQYFEKWGINIPSKRKFLFLLLLRLHCKKVRKDSQKRKTLI